MIRWKMPLLHIGVKSNFICKSGVILKGVRRSALFLCSLSSSGHFLGAVSLSGCRILFLNTSS
jgi:hypothetical protein